MTCLKFRWPALFAAVALLCPSYVLASTALLPASPTAGQTWSVQTYAGPAELTVTAIHPASSITILFLVDTLASAENEQVRKELLDSYPSFRGHPLQIGFLNQKGEFTPPVPVSSRVRFKQLLDNVAKIGR